MTTLLDTYETPATQARSFGVELQASMAAVRLQVKWFGTRRSVTASQKDHAADMFEAASDFVSMGKKLIDTNHPAWKKLVAVRTKIINSWRNSTLPYPEPGIRLIRRSKLEEFMQTILPLRQELREAGEELAWCYDELRETARARLGRLYNPNDYPATLFGMFDVLVDHPNFEPPDYLQFVSPSLYRQAITAELEYLTKNYQQIKQIEQITKATICKICSIC